MPALARLAPLLAVLLILAPDCGRDSAVAHEASPSTNASVPSPPPATSVDRPARAVIRAFAPSATETIHLSPSVVPEQESPQPTADYPSLEAARDSIGAMVERAVNRADPAVRVSGGPVRFKYWYAADSADGWAFHIVVTDTSGCPNESLQNMLIAAGWAPFYGYAADGPDGGTLGLVSKRYLCIVEGRWDGGDDSDTTYVPEAGCEVTVTCVPRREARRSW